MVSGYLIWARKGVNNPGFPYGSVAATIAKDADTQGEDDKTP